MRASTDRSCLPRGVSAPSGMHQCCSRTRYHGAWSSAHIAQMRSVLGFLKRVSCGPRLLTSCSQILPGNVTRCEWMTTWSTTVLAMCPLVALYLHRFLFDTSMQRTSAVLDQIVGGVRRNSPSAVLASLTRSFRRMTKTLASGRNSAMPIPTSAPS